MDWRLFLTVEIKAEQEIDYFYTVTHDADGIFFFVTFVTYRRDPPGLLPEAFRARVFAGNFGLSFWLRCLSLRIVSEAVMCIEYRTAGPYVSVSIYRAS